MTLDYTANVETPLDDVPDAVRVYPASAGNIMLPLTPANNYTATILFCGGSNVQPKQYVLLSSIFISLLHFYLLSVFPYYVRWTQKSFIIPTYPASTSCVKLTPDVSGSYVQDDDLPDARSMANFIALPDGKVLNLNGARLGKLNPSLAHPYSPITVLTHDSLGV